MPFIPRIALTPGEPAGIGPDLAIMLAQRPHACEIVAIADPSLLEQRARLLHRHLILREFDPSAEPSPQAAGQLTVLSNELAQPVTPGQLDKHNSRYVLKTIHRAVRGCLDGWFDALVTGPVHKGIINDSGITFSGHTEYIAEITGGYPVMMLATPGLRVALVTTHLPLARVSEALSHHRLRTTLITLHQALQSHFALPSPRIVVCGLNPHAGESGHLGREEIDIIEPVLTALRDKGMNLIGPVPADTAFTPQNLAATDVVVAMYHDQGLPVLKHMGFGQAVNITLGLPIIRTSVDHGTALQLAGSDRIEVGSLEYALQMALQLVANRRHAPHES